MERKFTRKGLIEKLENLSKSFHDSTSLQAKMRNTANIQFEELAVFFVKNNIPIKYNNERMKYEIVDKSILNRIISEEHEKWLEELNYLNLHKFSLDNVSYEVVVLRIDQLKEWLKSVGFSIHIVNGEFVFEDVN